LGRAEKKCNAATECSAKIGAVREQCERKGQWRLARLPLWGGPRKVQGSAKIGAVRSKIGAVRSKIGAVRSKIGAVRSKIGAVRSKIGAVREQCERKGQWRVARLFGARARYAVRNKSAIRKLRVVRMLSVCVKDYQAARARIARIRRVTGAASVLLCVPFLLCLNTCSV
jgi:hypothetical protein